METMVAERQRVQSCGCEVAQNGFEEENKGARVQEGSYAELDACMGGCGSDGCGDGIGPAREWGRDAVVESCGRGVRMSRSVAGE